jgi:hypothetical protein
MKFNFKIGNKDLVELGYKIFLSEVHQSTFVIGIDAKCSEQDRIYNAIENEQFKVYISHSILALELDDVIYSFDLNDFLEEMGETLKNGSDILRFGFGFLDENGKLKKQSIKSISLVV